MRMTRATTLLEEEGIEIEKLSPLSGKDFFQICIYLAMEHESFSSFNWRKKKIKNYRNQLSPRLWNWLHRKSLC